MPSSVIASFSYNSASLTLTIIFVSGMVYNYVAVPQEVYDEMKAAFSKGTFFNEHIKGKYAFKKVKQAK